MARSGRGLVVTAWCTALTLGALGQAACGGDDEGSSSSSSSGSSTSSSGMGGEGGSTSTSSTGTGGSTSTSSTGTGGSTSTSSTGTGGGELCQYTGLGECAPGQAWELDLADPCVCCSVQNCASQGDDCCNETGCMAIVDCVRTSGCSGFDCLGPCGQVISQNGGISGAPLAAAQAFGDCVEVPCATCDD